MASLKELRLLEKVWSFEMQLTHAPIKELYSRVQNTGLFAYVQKKSKIELCFLVTVLEFHLPLAWDNAAASQALLRKFIDGAEAEEKKGYSRFSLKREREEYKTPIAKKVIFHDVSPPRELLSLSLEQPRQLQDLFGCASLRKELIALARQPPFFSDLMQAVFEENKPLLVDVGVALKMTGNVSLRTLQVIT
jgi:hypothetical protein